MRWRSCPARAATLNGNSVRSLQFSNGRHIGPPACVSVVLIRMDERVVADPQRAIPPKQRLAAGGRGMGLHRTGEHAHLRRATVIARDKPSLLPNGAAFGPRRGGPACASHARYRQVRRAKNLRLGFDPQRGCEKRGLVANGWARLAAFRLACGVAQSDVCRNGLLVGGSRFSSEADRRPEHESAEEHQGPKSRPTPHGGDYRGEARAGWPCSSCAITPSTISVIGVAIDGLLLCCVVSSPVSPLTHPGAIGSVE